MSLVSKEDSTGRVIYNVVDVYRQSALSLINEGNPKYHVKKSHCKDSFETIILLYINSTVN